MAKKPAKRRRSNKFRAIRVATSVTLGALANNGVVASGLNSGGFDNEIYAISVDAMISVRNLTAGEGPLLCGYAHSDYTTAEIAEAILAQDGLFDNLIEQEQGKRHVRDAGFISGIASEEVLFDGKVKRTKLGFRVGDAQDVQMFVMNRSGATLTTGGIVETVGKLYLTLQ